MDIRREGNPDGFPVIALHGIQGTNASWGALAAALGDTFRFILPNMPGRGDAGAPASPQACSVHAFARVASAVIEQEIGEGPYALAGWSMGVSVILELMAHLAHGAARHRAPVAAVLMSGTAQPNDVSWFVSTDETALLAEIRQRERRLNLRQAAEPRAVAWTWRALKSVSHLPNLAFVTMPTLIVHGGNDEDCPIVHAHRMQAGIRHASLHVIADAGHSILTQNTQEVSAVVRGFLTKHCEAPAPRPTPSETP